MSIRTFQIVESYDAFSTKALEGFRNKQLVSLTTIEITDSFSERRSGTPQPTAMEFRFVLLSHEDNGLTAGAYIDSDVYTTIVANPQEITFQVIQ